MSPLLSLIIDADGPGVRTTVTSLARQSYRDAEVVLAGPGRRWPARGRPVRVRTPAGGTRSTRLELARRAARGRFVAVLDAGDQLEPGALAAVAALLERHPSAGLLYTDEQWPAAGAEGIRTKPDFAPALLESYPYVGRLAFIRADLLDRVGGFAPQAAGAEEYDVALAVCALGEPVLHLPAVALTRARPPATGAPVDEACAQVVRRHLERSSRAGRVETTSVPGGSRTWLTWLEPPMVSIVLPTAGARRRIRGVEEVLVTRCVRSLLDTAGHDRWQVVLVTSEGCPSAVVEEVRALLGDRLTVAPVSGPFNFSRSVNEGAAASTGDLLLLLNDDTEVIEPRWLERMVAVAADERVGAVGAKLLFEDGTIQHVGVTFDDEMLPIHALGSEPDGLGPLGAKVLDTDWSAVTGACLLTPADLFAQLGGFAENMPLNYNDVDYCLKVGAAGRRVLTTPFARLWHYESSSRGHRIEQSEVDLLDRTWHLRIGADLHREYRSRW